MWRTTPICVETWKPSSPRAPHTSSVEPPPMSITTRSVGSSGGRAAVAPANVKRGLLVAGERAALEPEAVAHRRGERRAVRGVAHRGGHHRGARLALVRGDLAGVALERGEHARLRRVAEPAGRVDALAQPRDDRLADGARVTPPPGSTSAISSRVELVPMSTTATRMRRAGRYTVARTMRRLVLPAALAALALFAASAVAAGTASRRSRRRRATRPGRQAAPTFKINVQGAGSRSWVHVCKSKQKDADGMICHDESIGQARKKQGSRFEYKAEVLRLPGVLAQHPRHVLLAGPPDRVRGRDVDDCRHRGPDREVQGGVM